MTTAWTAFQIWTKCSHLGAHTSHSPRPSFIYQLYRLHGNGSRIWHLLRTSLSGKWFHTLGEQHRIPTPGRTTQASQSTLKFPSQKLLCAEKELFWTINTVKIWQNSRSYPKKMQIFLINISSNLGSWWDSIQLEPKISALAGETCCYIFSSNDLYNGKLRERTKSCSFSSQRSTEITIRANEVTQHFSSPSRKPTKSSSLNQLFNISAVHRYYGY